MFFYIKDNGITYNSKSSGDHHFTTTDTPFNSTLKTAFPLASVVILLDVAKLIV